MNLITGLTTHHRNQARAGTKFARSCASKGEPLLQHPRRGCGRYPRRILMVRIAPHRLGSEFDQALDAAFELLRQAPEAGPEVYRDVRRVLLRRFPYSVYYTLTSSEIEIRAVAHMHRDPVHWQQRR